MATKKKVGIIGFGMAGRNMHYKALVDGLSDKVEVTAVWNRSEMPREGRSAADFPAADSVTIYSGIEQFFEHPGLDVVHVTTPSGQHLEFIERAARAGLHVICDKPLDVTLSRIDRAIALCEENGVMLSVSFQQRSNPHIVRLKKLLEQGVIGDPVDGSASIILYRQPEYYTESAWHGRYNLDGGAALMNQGIHYIDLIQWFMESPVTEVSKGVTERLVHTYIEGEDFGYGELKLANGAGITIMGGTCFRPGFGQGLEVRGTKGWVRVEGGIITKAFWDGDDRLEVFGEAVTVEASASSPEIGLENHISFFRDVYNALDKNGDNPIDGDEARKSTEIILGIYKASETGQPVTFPFDVNYRPGNK